MMSTFILERAIVLNTRNAMPGSSGTPTTAMRATSLSFAMPLIFISSIFFATSLTFVPGFRT